MASGWIELFRLAKHITFKPWNADRAKNFLQLMLLAPCPAPSSGESRGKGEGGGGCLSRPQYAKCGSM